MRIVYDDTQFKSFIDLFVKFIDEQLYIKDIVRYDYGMNRVQRGLFKEQFNNFLSDFYMEIGKDVYHRGGIGNNCRYPVFYYEEANEIQQMGYINLNTDMYSGMYVYFTDYNDNRVGVLWEVTPRGVTVKNE